MTDVFISYKREEREKARALAEFLALHGYSVWWDAELLAGDEFGREISEVISRAKSAIVLWSEEASRSSFVLTEAAQARARGILIPATLDGAIPPLPFSDIHTLNLSSWDGDAGSSLLDPLLTAVESKAGTRSIARSSQAAVEVLKNPELEVEFWQSIVPGSQAEREQLQAYIDRFAPDPAFYELAVARLNALNKRRLPSFMKAVSGATAVVALVAGIVEVGDRFGFWSGFPRAQPEKEILERFDAVDIAVTTGYWADFTRSTVFNCVEEIEVPTGFVLVGGELGEERIYPERQRVGCAGPEYCNGHNEFCRTQARSPACLVNSEWYYWYIAQADEEGLPIDFDSICGDLDSA